LVLTDGLERCGGGLNMVPFVVHAFCRARRLKGLAPPAEQAEEVVAGASPARPGRIRLDAANIEAPSFWELNKPELMLAAVLVVLAAIIIYILTSSYNDELERFLRKLIRAGRLEIAKRPWLTSLQLW